MTILKFVIYHLPIEPRDNCMRSQRNTLKLAILIALGHQVGARAAEAEPAEIPAVKVVGHYDNAVGTSDAASQGTITADLIANRPALRTGELLEFVPESDQY